METVESQAAILKIGERASIADLQGRADRENAIAQAPESRQTMNLLSTAQALARFNDRLGQHGMSRANFNARIIPLLAEAGHARKIGREWVVDGRDFWMWEVYASARVALIDAGEWSAGRAWSVADMEAIAIRDEYEDFGPATAWQ